MPILCWSEGSLHLITLVMGPHSFTSKIGNLRNSDCEKDDSISSQLALRLKPKRSMPFIPASPVKAPLAAGKKRRALVDHMPAPRWDNVRKPPELQARKKNTQGQMA
mmetsp:Transcript_68484/g.130338  ORF Transcript_68484/g.130338 Transcript_68484/m.130338 type:complete len:107 (+) Transcript_68484:755-1075(+)